MAHVPAYAGELVKLRHARLAPAGAFVIVTNDWPLAKAVRACGSCALVVRERDEPDLRGCYGLRVLVSLPQVDALAGALGLLEAPGRASPSIERFLAAIAMAEGAKPHEIEALEALVRPIAAACDAARAAEAFMCRHASQMLVWSMAQRQVAAAAARERA